MLRLANFRRIAHWLVARGAFPTFHRGYYSKLMELRGICGATVSNLSPQLEVTAHGVVAGDALEERNWHAEGSGSSQTAGAPCHFCGRPRGPVRAEIATGLAGGLKWQSGKARMAPPMPRSVEGAPGQRSSAARQDTNQSSSRESVGTKHDSKSTTFAWIPLSFAWHLRTPHRMSETVVGWPHASVRAGALAFPANHPQLVLVRCSYFQAVSIQLSFI